MFLSLKINSSNLGACISRRQRAHLIQSFPDPHPPQAGNMKMKPTKKIMSANCPHNPDHE